MAFCLLLRRVDMPGTKVSCNDPVAQVKGSSLDRSKLYNVVPLLSTFKMRVLRSNQGLYRAYDVTQLPVT